jgi:hypothetical protein
MSLLAWNPSSSPFLEPLRLALAYGAQIRAALLWALLTGLILAWLYVLLFTLFNMRVASFRLRRALIAPPRGPDGKPLPIDLRLLWRSLGWFGALLLVLAAGYLLHGLIGWVGAPS